MRPFFKVRGYPVRDNMNAALQDAIQHWYMTDGEEAVIRDQYGRERGVVWTGDDGLPRWRRR